MTTALNAHTTQTRTQIRTHAQTDADKTGSHTTHKHVSTRTANLAATNLKVAVFQLTYETFATTRSGDPRNSFPFLPETNTGRQKGRPVQKTKLRSATYKPPGGSKIECSH